MKNCKKEKHAMTSIQIKCTEAEKQQIRKNAEQTHLSVSGYVRKASMEGIHSNGIQTCMVAQRMPAFCNLIRQVENDVIRQELQKWGREITTIIATELLTEDEV